MMTVITAVTGGPADNRYSTAARTDHDESGPFPGLASYDYDRRSSFLGRDTETRHLATMILGRRLTVLTAGSGDGKTSLIHAGLAPSLLADRIEVGCAEPGLNEEQPFEAMRSLFLDRLLPRSGDMSELLARLIAHFSAEETFRTVRKACMNASPQQRQIWLNGGIASRPTSTLKGGPLVGWLRDDNLCDEFVKAAMLAWLGESWLGFDISLGEQQAALPAPVARMPLPAEPEQARARLLAELEAAIDRRLAADSEFEVVLVLDQFEEIFVRLSGSDAAAKREAILDFTLELIQRPWPVRLVLSLRKEHYADLQAAFGSRLALEPSTYHLQPLSLEQAERCLTGQEWKEGAPSPELAQDIVRSISYDDRFVNPTLLSVAGQHLWQKRKEGSAEADISGLVPRALEAFVRRIIESELTELDRHEAFDMFDQLMLRDGVRARRASVAKLTLVAAPLRDAGLRERILRKLQQNRLVREEMRLGGVYVEVVHESLLPVIQMLAEKLRASMPLCAEFPALIDDIRTEAREPAIQMRPVPKRLYPVLLDNIERLRPPPHLAARMLGRLLLDPELRELARRGKPRLLPPLGHEQSSSPPQGTARLRELCRKLDSAAKGAHAEESPSQRLADGDLMLPAEADCLLETPGRAPDLASISLAVASSLTHRDERVHERIRRLGKMLRQLKLT